MSWWSFSPDLKITYEYKTNPKLKPFIIRVFHKTIELKANYGRIPSFASSLMITTGIISRNDLNL